ncbi:hypothetical protein HDU86_008225 [Geranomyces michiganensis]|nr:hypothetical protein HDU86_008225 [Geranomyces michiganensis]
MLAHDEEASSHDIAPSVAASTPAHSSNERPAPSAPDRTPALARADEDNSTFLRTSCPDNSAQPVPPSSPGSAAATLAATRSNPPAASLCLVEPDLTAAGDSLASTKSVSESVAATNRLEASSSLSVDSTPGPQEIMNDRSTGDAASSKHEAGLPAPAVTQPALSKAADQKRSQLSDNGNDSHPTTGNWKVMYEPDLDESRKDKRGKPRVTRHDGVVEGKPADHPLQAKRPRDPRPELADYHLLGRGKKRLCTRMARVKFEISMAIHEVHPVTAQNVGFASVSYAGNAATAGAAARKAVAAMSRYRLDGKEITVELDADGSYTQLIEGAESVV